MAGPPQRKPPVILRFAFFIFHFSFFIFHFPFRN